MIKTAVQEVSELISKLSSMRNLGRNRGFKMYRAIIGNALWAELMSYFDDMLGGKYETGEPRVGVLIVKKKYEILRNLQLKLLTDLTAVESKLMSIGSLHQEFPIPDEVATSTKLLTLPEQCALTCSAVCAAVDQCASLCRRSQADLPPNSKVRAWRVRNNRNNRSSMHL